MQFILPASSLYSDSRARENNKLMDITGAEPTTLMLQASQATDSEKGKVVLSNHCGHSFVGK